MGWVPGLVILACFTTYLKRTKDEEQLQLELETFIQSVEDGVSVHNALSEFNGENNLLVQEETGLAE